MTKMDNKPQLVDFKCFPPNSVVYQCPMRTETEFYYFVMEETIA